MDIVTDEFYVRFYNLQWNSVLVYLVNSEQELANLSKNVVHHLLVGGPCHRVIFDCRLAQFYSGGVDWDVFILRGTSQEHVLETMQIGIFRKFVHEGFSDIGAVFQSQLLQRSRFFPSLHHPHTSIN